MLRQSFVDAAIDREAARYVRARWVSETSRNDGLLYDEVSTLYGRWRNDTAMIYRYHGDRRWRAFISWPAVDLGLFWHRKDAKRAVARALGAGVD